MLAWRACLVARMTLTTMFWRQSRALAVSFFAIATWSPGRSPSAEFSLRSLYWLPFSITDSSAACNATQSQRAEMQTYHDPPTQPPTHSLTHSLTHSFSCLLSHSLTHSLTHSHSLTAAPSTVDVRRRRSGLAVDFCRRTAKELDCRRSARIHCAMFRSAFLSSSSRLFGKLSNNSMTF